MRRLLTFATLFASLLPLSSAAVEVSTQDNLKSAWETGGEIKLTTDITLSDNSVNGWTAGNDVTLTGSHKLIQASREVGETAYALLYSTHVVSISGVTLQNQTRAYMLDAESLSLTDVTIASHSATSATAAICTYLTLSGTLTLDLNSPCNTLLSCYSADTTGLSGITIHIGSDFSLGNGGATNLILFSGTDPAKVEEFKCTVTGASGYYVVLQKMPGGTVLCLVPEPGSATLTLIGLIALLHRRRRPCSMGIHGGAYVRG
ncbi:MAG: PEP-CTERM sorting domain-containing protein [Akkermansia muciniphila]|nr:PEP-CTERM sorting domain-containing protein [Akkermansia muciniphila]